MNIIYDNETHSLCPFEMGNLRVHDLILNPTTESCSWYTPLKSDEAWQVHQCFAKTKLRENEVVQIKYDLSSRSLLVYCYPFNITLIQGNFVSNNMPCPDYVFNVPNNCTLKIANLSFVTHNLKFDSRYNLVPEWLHLINQRLLPDLHSHNIALNHDEIKSRIRKMNTDLIVSNKIDNNSYSLIVIILSTICIVLNLVCFGPKLCNCLRRTYCLNLRSKENNNVGVEGREEVGQRNRTGRVLFKVTDYNLEDIS